MKGRKKVQVVYGTSDHLLNVAEVLLTLWAAESEGGEAVFFNYPKGPEWASWEERLFEPYEPLPLDPQEALQEAGLPAIRVIPLQMMVGEELGGLLMGEIGKLIRARREIKSFRAINLSDAKPVYVSSKDKAWRRLWAGRLLGEVITLSDIKLGGAFIYFVYGAWLARHPEIVGILPGKRRADVLGAFRAGEDWAGNRAQVLATGEFDFMSARQWAAWEARGRRGWRKAPSWALAQLLRKPALARRLRDRLINERLYTPLVYDENTGGFYLKEECL